MFCLLKNTFFKRNTEMSLLVSKPPALTVPFRDIEWKSYNSILWDKQNSLFNYNNLKSTFEKQKPVTEYTSDNKYEYNITYQIIFRINEQMLKVSIFVAYYFCTCTYSLYLKNFVFLLFEIVNVFKSIKTATSATDSKNWNLHYKTSMIWITSWSLGCWKQ